MALTPDTRLAPNFTLGELTATSHSKYRANNFAFGADSVDKLREVAALLQAGRDHFGRPFKVHSGARSPGLNAAVGGSRSSQHMKCEAVDFSVRGVPLVDVWRWYALNAGLHFGQLILEKNAAGEDRWIHLSLGQPYRPANRCMEVMVSPVVNGRRRYNRVDAATWGR